eukprot:c18022_g1_i1.p1 GENE.c18022_g1_i1~~c18022_g1_i1.p1  ORF type:complete len:241 (+),score=69.37 c18022_g1_i1:100-822(+)
MRRRNHQSIIPIIMGMRLFHEISQIQNKPVITLSIIGLCCLIHFRHEVSLPFPPVYDVCISPAIFWSHLNLEMMGRVLFSKFYHSDEWHLYYNCASLTWKGMRIEQSVGPEEFLKIFILMLIISESLYMSLSSLMPELELLSTCTIGISGVIFALKVIVNQTIPAQTQFMGFSIDIKYIAWVELLWYYLIDPYSSFYGHLCGIAAGYLYLFLAPKLQQLSSTTTRRSRNWGSGTTGTNSQ